MTSASKAVVDAIDTNWNVGTGGTKPAIYNSEAVSMFPTDDDWVMDLNWQYGKKRKRRNESFVGEKDYVGLRVHSRNDATKEARLDEIVNEIYRVVTPANVSGYNVVDIIDQHRRESDKRTNTYIADLLVELVILSTASASTPGSTTTSTITVDELTVTDAVGVGGAPSADQLMLLENDGAKPQLCIQDSDDGVKWRFTENAGTLAIDPISGTDRVFDVKNTGAGDADIHIDSLSVRSLLMLGSANATWVPVAFDGWTGQHPDVGNPGHRTFDATNPTWQFVLGWPTTKGTLKLYINGVRIVVTDADGAAYVDQTRVMGTTDAGFTSVYTANENTDSVAVWESGSGLTAWGAADDMSSYGAVRVYLNIVSAGLGRLDISSIQLSCYYA